MPGLAPVADWRMNQGAGSLVVDVSNNGGNGVINGAVAWSSDCADPDGDGFTAATDCNDNDPNIYPRAGDTYGDGVDSDCDGLIARLEQRRSYFAACPSRIDLSATVKRWLYGLRF